MNNSAIKTFGDLMDTFLNNGVYNDSYVKNNVMPPVNINETENGFNIDIMVPGLNKEDIKLQVKENILTISYEKQEAAQAENVKVLRSEFNINSFKRSFTLGKKVDAKNIQASMNNGILSIQLPKKVEEKPKELNISIQ